MMMGNSGGGGEVQNQGESTGMDGGVGGGTQLKKGPWTAAEDAILADYVRKNGEGNWNAVQKNTGLARCGKSCRLRWANHLRPNLKKGAFSPEEERIIVELHAKLGNKWARMATQLPGRTDNEIKNFWNTRVKRRQRQGLSLYPPEIQPLLRQQQQSSPQNQQFSPYQSEPTTPMTSNPTTPTGFSFQTTLPLSHHSPHGGSTPTNLHSPHQTNPMLLSPMANASPLPSPHTPVYPTLPLFDSSAANPSTSANFSSRPPPSLQAPPRFKRLHREVENDSNYLNPNCFNFNSRNADSSFAFQFSPILGHNSATSTPNSYPNYPNFASNQVCFGQSSRAVRPHLDSGQMDLISDYIHPFRTELPSSQMMFQDCNPEVTFNSRVNDGNGAVQNMNENQNFGDSICGSGLLEDLLEESNALAGENEGFGRQNYLCSSSQEEKQVHGGFSSWGDASSVGLVATVLKPKEETTDQMQSAHEDLSKLLNVIPSSMQVPEWYTGDSREASNGQSSVVTDDNLGIEMHHLASLCPIDTTSDHGTVPNSCSWDNLPGIC